MVYHIPLLAGAPYPGSLAIAVTPESLQVRLQMYCSLQKGDRCAVLQSAA